MTGAMAGAADRAQIVDNFYKLPLAFEKNQGQARRGVDFVARSSAYSVALSHGNARLSVGRKPGGGQASVNLRLMGARVNGIASGAEILPSKVNYFIGKDASRWRVDIPTFARVDYHSVYRGIDLEYYGNQGRLEYDFMVAPGADAGTIRLAVDGARKIGIDRAGELVIETEGGMLAFQKPVTYQEIGEARHLVESSYTVSGANEVRFRLGNYDHRRKLIIDPSLVYSTLVGGSGYQTGVSIAAGPNGKVYITGYTSSMDFPLAKPEQTYYTGSSAIFIAELSADGSGFIYASYLGGSNTDSPYSIAVDSAGDAYVAGATSSIDFPVKNALYPILNGPQDAFVTELSPAGNRLLYSTYLGGSDYDYAVGIAVDGEQNAYVAGYTSSTDFPTTAGGYLTIWQNSESFVTKLNAGGSQLAWSTYFGPNYSAYVNAIAIDTNENVYLTGASYAHLPVSFGAPQSFYSGNVDAFIAQVNQAGSALSYVTYLGGSGEDSGYAIAVDSGGNAYVAGATNSTDFPVTASALQFKTGGGVDGFVAKINSGGTAWDYVTYLGGQRDDYAFGIAVDSSGNATVAGYTISANFPRYGALQPTLAGNDTLLFKTVSSGAAWRAADSGIAAAVNQVAVDPASGQHLIAATSEGIYESTDGGVQWHPAGPPQVYFESVNFAPSGGGAIYALSFNALYASSDNGATWAFAGDVYDFGCSSGENLAIDPTSAEILYVAGGYCFSGATQSSDGGATWTALTGLPQGAYLFNIAVDPNSARTLFASSSSGILESADGGQSWNVIYPSAASLVAVNPKNPAMLYGVFGGQVYVSRNSGGSWSPANSGLNGSVISFAIAPSKPAVLYASTSSGVFKSANGGASWSPAGLTQDGIYGLAVNFQNAATVYAISQVYPDAFAARISASGGSLIYSTYLGGTNYDFAEAVALNTAGDALITGYTGSPDFPTTSGAFQQGTGGNVTTAFVARITSKKPACTYTSSPSSYFFYPGGGGLNLSVVAPNGCAWTPAPSDSWITIQSHGGPGVGPLAISVAANTGAARSGTIAIGSGSIAIQQAAGGCNYSLSTYSLTFPQAGGPGSVGVTAGDGCDWVITSLPDWLTVTSGGSGSGNGTVNLQAAANPFPGTRYYNLVVAGNSLQLAEAGTSGATGPPQAPPPVLLQPKCLGAQAACPGLPGLPRRP